MAINKGGAPLNIANGIREFATASPNQIAIIDGDRSITYRELFERACRLANALLAANLKRGVAVGVTALALALLRLTGLISEVTLPIAALTVGASFVSPSVMRRLSSVFRRF